MRKMIQLDRLQKFRQAKALVEYYFAQTPAKAVPDHHEEVERWFNKNRRKQSGRRDNCGPETGTFNDGQETIFYETFRKPTSS